MLKTPSASAKSDDSGISMMVNIEKESKESSLVNPPAASFLRPARLFEVTGAGAVGPDTIWPSKSGQSVSGTYQKAGAIQGSNVNSAATGVVAGATNRDTRQGEISASNLSTPKSACSIGVSARADSASSAVMSMNLKQSNLTTGPPSLNSVPPGQKDAAVTENRTDDLLRAIQRWTNSTGDTSVLRWLVKNFRDLNANVRVRPGEPEGEDSSGRRSNAASPWGEAHSSNGTISKSSHNNDGDSSRRKDEAGQGRLNLKITHGSHTKRARLRCPLFFGEEGHRCHTLHKYIRDLM